MSRNPLPSLQVDVDITEGSLLRSPDSSPPVRSLSSFGLRSGVHSLQSSPIQTSRSLSTQTDCRGECGGKACVDQWCPLYSVYYTDQRLQTMQLLSDVQYLHVCVEGLLRENKCRHFYAVTLTGEATSSKGLISMHVPILEPFSCCLGGDMVVTEKQMFRDQCWLKTGISAPNSRTMEHVHVTPRFLYVLDYFDKHAEGDIGEYSAVEIGRLIKQGKDLLIQHGTSVVIEKDTVYGLQQLPELLLHSTRKTDRIRDICTVREYYLYTHIPHARHIILRTHTPLDWRQAAAVTTSLSLLPYHSSYHACDPNSFFGEPTLVRCGILKDELPPLLYWVQPILPLNLLLSMQRLGSELSIRMSTDPLLWILWLNGDLSTIYNTTQVTFSMRQLRTVVGILDSATDQESTSIITVSLYDFVRIVLSWTETKFIGTINQAPQFVFSELRIYPRNAPAPTVSPGMMNTTLMNLRILLNEVLLRHKDTSPLMQPGNIIALAELYGNNKATLNAADQMLRNMRQGLVWTRLEVLKQPLLHSNHGSAVFALLPNLTTLSRRFARGDVLSGLLLTPHIRSLDLSYSMFEHCNGVPSSLSHLPLLQAASDGKNPLLDLLLLSPHQTSIILQGVSFSMSTAFIQAHFVMLEHLDLSYSSVNSLYSLWPQRCLPFLKNLSILGTELSSSMNFRSHIMALFYDQIHCTSLQSPCIQLSHFEVTVKTKNSVATTYSSADVPNTPFLLNGASVSTAEGTSSEIVAQSLASLFEPVTLLTIHQVQQAHIILNSYCPYTLPFANALWCKHVLGRLKVDGQTDIVETRFNSTVVHPNKSLFTTLTPQYGAKVEQPSAQTFASDKDVYAHIVQHYPRHQYSVQSVSLKHAVLNGLACALPLNITEEVFNSCLLDSSAPDYSTGSAVKTSYIPKSAKNSAQKKKVKPNYVRFEDEDGVLAPIAVPQRARKSKGNARKQNLEVDDCCATPLNVAAECIDGVSVSETVVSSKPPTASTPASTYVEVAEAAAAAPNYIAMLLSDLQVTNYDPVIQIDQSIDEQRSRECEPVFAPHVTAEYLGRPIRQSSQLRVRDLVVRPDTLFKAERALPQEIDGIAAGLAGASFSFLNTVVLGEKMHFSTKQGKVSVAGVSIPWQRMPLLFQLTLVQKDNTVHLLRHDRPTSFVLQLRAVFMHRGCLVLSVGEAELFILSLECPCTETHSNACFVERWCSVLNMLIAKTGVYVHSAIPPVQCTHQQPPEHTYKPKPSLIASKLLIQNQLHKLKKLSPLSTIQTTASNLQHSHMVGMRFLDHPYSLMMLLPLMICVCVATGPKIGCIPLLQAYRDSAKRIYPANDSLMYQWSNGLLERVQQTLLEGSTESKLLSVVSCALHPFALALLPTHVLAHSLGIGAATCTLHPAQDHQLYIHCPFLGVYTREFTTTEPQSLTPHGLFMPGTDGNPVTLVKDKNVKKDEVTDVSNSKHTDLTQSSNQYCTQHLPSEDASLYYGEHDPLCQSTILFEKYVCAHCTNQQSGNVDLAYETLLLPCLSDAQLTRLNSLSSGAINALRSHADRCVRTGRSLVRTLPNRVYCNLFDSPVHFADLTGLPVVNVAIESSDTADTRSLHLAFSNLDCYRDLEASTVTRTSAYELSKAINAASSPGEQFILGSFAPNKTFASTTEIAGKGVFLVGTTESLQTFHCTPMVLHCSETEVMHIYKIHDTHPVELALSCLTVLDVAASGQFVQVVCSTQGHANISEEGSEKWQRTIIPFVQRFITCTPSYTHTLVELLSRLRERMYTKRPDHNVVTIESGSVQHSLLEHLVLLTQTNGRMLSALPCTPYQVVAAIYGSDSVDSSREHTHTLLSSLSKSIQLEQLEFVMAGSLRGVVGSVQMFSLSGVKKSFQLVSPISDILTATTQPAVRASAITLPAFPSAPTVSISCSLALLNNALFVVVESDLVTCRHAGLKYPFFDFDDHRPVNASQRLPLSQSWMHAQIQPALAEERNLIQTLPEDPYYAQSHPVMQVNDTPVTNTVHTIMALTMDSLLDVICTPISPSVTTLTIIFGHNPLFQTNIGNAVVLQFTTTAVNAKKFLEKR